MVLSVYIVDCKYDKILKKFGVVYLVFEKMLGRFFVLCSYL